MTSIPRHRLDSRASVALVALALASGCGSHPSESMSPARSEVDGTIPDPSEGTGGDSSTAATPESFSRPFTALVSQPVPFSASIITVASASVNRGQSNAVPPDVTYVQLDFTVQNTSATDLDYSWRQTWDLVLADGTRVPPSNPLGIKVAGHHTGKGSLRYPVDATVSLTGAAVILDGGERGVVEPERVPLDSPWSSRYPTSIPSLLGATSTSADAIRSLELTVSKATVSLNDPDEYRAELGKKFVRLDLLAKNLSSFRGGSNLMDDSFRIIVDGLSLAPENFINELLDPQTTMNVPVIFQIDEASMSFDIRFAWYGLAQTYHVNL